MNIEEIKVGETYNVRVKVTLKTSESITAETVDKNGRFLCENYFAEEETATFSPIAASIGYMKHDPCRDFKVGDIVRAKHEGIYSDFEDDEPIDISTQYKVVDVEKGWVNIFCEPIDSRWVWEGTLELVTPVEELEPYIIREYADFYAVEKDGAQYSIFFKGSYHANAKAAAETERDRLNAERRKEQNND